MKKKVGFALNREAASAAGKKGNIAAQSSPLKRRWNSETGKAAGLKAAELRRAAKAGVA